MRKSATITRSSSTGRFVSKTVGKGKAAKFALVEGMSLNERSATLMARMERRGLKGDAMRSAIAGSFTAKRS
ncbi:hypothetical protein SAMN04488037_11927 [Shimia marina]|uniref:Uncharacterized protein n=1 Tax=Shimia marina TaxID=321267 RepID=A0A0P1EQJ6_9RHOB|nr:hypothetical protein SHM7688_02142 [Shimia marina]SFE75592.1 hypothetical protein SAMN04488037_11927 [Shimia marina]